jgi:hypothetical protein
MQTNASLWDARFPAYALHLVHAVAQTRHPFEMLAWATEGTCLVACAQQPANGRALSEFRAESTPGTVPESIGTQVLESNRDVCTDFRDFAKRLAPRMSLIRGAFKLHLPFEQLFMSTPPGFHRRT